MPSVKSSRRWHRIGVRGRTKLLRAKDKGVQWMRRHVLARWLKSELQSQRGGA